MGHGRPQTDGVAERAICTKWLENRVNKVGGRQLVYQPMLILVRKGK